MSCTEHRSGIIRSGYFAFRSSGALRRHELLMNAVAQELAEGVSTWSECLVSAPSVAGRPRGEVAGGWSMFGIREDLLKVGRWGRLPRADLGVVLGVGAASMAVPDGSCLGQGLDHPPRSSLLLGIQNHPPQSPVTRCSVLRRHPHRPTDPLGHP